MDDGVAFIWGIGALVLVISGLVSQRLPLGKTIKMLLAWLAIFAGIFVLFLFEDEGREVWRRVTAEISGDAGQVVGQSFRIRRDSDGHFWARALVNGKPVKFMIDSGATTTTLSRSAAASAGVEASLGFPVLVNTANGMVELHRARAKTLSLGPIVQNDAALLIGSEGLGDTNLLGMSFLSALKSWRVEGATLILEP